MSYAVKEIFYTLQGEGAQSGRPAVFCRFAGCNLWSGREEDRATAACSFCDTDFVGIDGTAGGRYETADALADRIAALWPAGTRDRFVVCTGGEPSLQLDVALDRCAARARFRDRYRDQPARFRCRPISTGFCVGPARRAPPRLALIKSGDELKIVVPQDGLDPLAFAELGFRRFSVQPMDGPERARNTELADPGSASTTPKWQLSLQTHVSDGNPLDFDHDTAHSC